MIPSCFSQPNTPSSKTSRDHHDHHQEEQKDDQEPNQSLITCIYQTTLFDSPTFLTLTWSKTLSSHTLTVQASDNSFSTTVSLRPPSLFSLFRPKPGSKSVRPARRKDGEKITLRWDFTRAEFARGSAEPESRFYLALAAGDRVEFFLGELPGDLARRAAAREPAAMTARREHAFGRGRRFWSRAVVAGERREVGIECGGGTMRVTVDGEARLVVRRLAWKFRGNERISVGKDGVEVEFFWDVLNWFTGDGNGHGVFVFQAGDGGVWPEMVGPERRLLRKSAANVMSVMDKANYNYNHIVGNSNNYYYCNNNSNNNYYNNNSGLSRSPSSWSSVLQWAEESSDGGSRSSCSSSARSSVGNNNNISNNNGGFSLLLYAWRRD